MRCEPTKTKLNFFDSLTQISTISYRRLTDLNLHYGMLCTALLEQTSEKTSIILSIPPSLHTQKSGQTTE